MEDSSPRDRQDAAPAKNSSAPTATATAVHRVLLVVGSHPRAEVGDRPLCYRLVAAIERWVQRHRERLDGEIRVEVCTDLWYLNHDDLRRRPTVCLGGPTVNALSSYLARHLLEDDRTAEVLLQVDPEFTDLQACVWGTDHRRTAYGVDVFIEKYLDGYLRAVATQIEP